MLLIVSFGKQLTIIVLASLSLLRLLGKDTPPLPLPRVFGPAHTATAG